MTPYQLWELNNASRIYHEHLHEVENWCEIVAKELGYTDADNILVRDGYVSFKAEWHGSYQAYDCNTFSVAADCLLKDPKEVGQRIKDEIKEAENKRKEEAKKQEIEDKKRLVQKLQSEIANAEGKNG